MVRRSRTAALGAALCAIFVIAGEQRVLSQALPRLHVLSFTLRTDARSPRVGQVFHLTIAGRLKERVAGVDFVILPNLAGLEPLGDERHAIAAAAGTDFSEILTVAARQPGQIHISGAYFDAIDARDGKPKRYYSNDLILSIGGVAKTGGSANSLVVFLAKLVGVLLLVFLLARVFLKRRSPTVPEPPPPPQPAAPSPTTAQDELSSAFASLKRDRDRPAVMRLRFALWKTAGARGGETLSDLLARNGAQDSLRRSLQTVERAAFVGDQKLRDAIDDAIATVEGQLS